MRVLLADDQVAVRSALRLLLEEEPGITVVGETDRVGSLPPILDEICPDVLLLDWELPGMAAKATVAALRRRRPGLLVVALSGRFEARAASLSAGVDAFVSKTEPADILLATLRRLRTLAALRGPQRCSDRNDLALPARTLS